jgi:glycosyltransferase involved in cell wall biosynthesis
LKIVHVCPFIGEQFGGSERFVSNISQVQAKEHDVHIFTTTRYWNRTGVRDENGVTMHRVYSPAAIWNIDPICFMIRKLSKTDADIFHIHSYLYTLSFQAALASVLRKKKTILQLHGGLGEPPYRTTITRRLVKRLYDKTLGAFVIKNSNIVSSVSMKDLQFVASVFSIGEEKLRYIPNTVDTRKFYPRSTIKHDQPKIILHVGDLEPWKGLGLVHRWLRSVSESNHHNLIFRFVGQGSLLPKFVRVQHEFQKKNNGIQIEILGQRKHDEIPEIMRNSDALIMTSSWEGMPTVILEAMASGLPIITTPVGDVPRILSNNETGILIDRSVKSLDESINRIANGDKGLDKMVSNAREMAISRFSLEQTNHAILEVINEIRQN